MQKESIGEGIGIISIIEYGLMKTVKSYFLIAVSVLVITHLAGCSYFFYVKAGGHVDEKVEFQFFKSLDDKESTKFNVLDFTVEEYRNDGSWVIVWAVRGEEPLSSIEYGKKYKGLDQAVEAKPLSKDAKYRALISATKWPSSGIGRSGVGFYFDGSGQLIQEKVAEN